MNKTIPIVHKVAILGAGVMGSQIAAHFANAGIPVVLFDLAVEGKDKSATARNAIKALAKQKPAPLARTSFSKRLTPCNYDDDLLELETCELIIEAIAERLDWKHDLYTKISPYINDKAVLASNTSGISITQLASGVPNFLRARFLGVHFFNPPRYMHLLELIAQPATRLTVMDQMESFFVSTMGKGVVRAKDTTNFIANRIGLFSMMATLYHAERLGLNFETIDELTGKAIGRPKSATLRTADVVGLDTMRHVLQGVISNLPDDPWAVIFKMPKWLDTLVENGSLGAKTRIGVYKKEDGEILVYDPDTDKYRKRKTKIPKKVRKIIKDYKNPNRLAELRAVNDPHAEFLWAIHRDTFHYCAHLLEDIAENTRDIDFAIRWGFGWKQGPFEIWQHSGWEKIGVYIQEDIALSRTPVDVPLPIWATGIASPHSPEGSWSASKQNYQAPSSLPVYKRQRWPQSVLGASSPSHKTLFENEGTHFWLSDDDVGVLSFKTKMHTINDAVLEGLQSSVAIAEKELRGMVIWQAEEPFSAGADLKSFMPVAMKNMLPGSTALDDLLTRFQAACVRMRHSDIPVVAGVKGLALGGGCELMMQTDRVVAALESYIGLVEVGVGVIPAGSGCMEFARRCSIAAGDDDLFPHLRKVFEIVAMGKVAESAEQAKEYGFLRESDHVVMNKHEVLHAAIEQVKALDALNYRPPVKQTIKAGGRAAIANFKGAMTNMHAGNYISDYDRVIGEHVANALCGGPIDAGTEVDEEWFLRYEREGFRTLLKNLKTHARIKHMLDTGKPLRN